jgi:phage gpG-like protein
LISEKLTLAALLVERTAKQPGYCPVKTGTARRSITRLIEKRRALVGSNVEYFPFIEMGTIKMAAHAPLRRALETNMSKIKKLFGAR